MKKTLFVAMAILCGMTAWTQWTPRTALPAEARTFAAAFSVNGKAYVIGGFDNLGGFTDCWQYDPATNSWTQKADFPGGPRSGAVAFSVGNKGYLGLGRDVTTYFDDLWEYDPTTDTWTQKAAFPGGQREEAVGFAIGSKAYVGTGQVNVTTPTGSFNLSSRDFYEYNPANDTWIHKADFPGDARAYAVGIGLDGKGYVGLGGNGEQTQSYADFYMYDPATNTWTTKSDYAATGRADAAIFTLGTDCYVVGGILFPGLSGTALCKKYNTETDTWSNDVAYGGGVVMAPVALTVNGAAFVGTGYTGALAPRKDWWKFTPPATASVPENAPAEIRVFPNPAYEQINISLGTATAQTLYRVVLVDMAGRQVFSGFFTADGMKTVNVSQLPQGTYILRVDTGNGATVLTDKFYKL